MGGRGHGAAVVCLAAVAVTLTSCSTAGSSASPVATAVSSQPSPSTQGAPQAPGHNDEDAEHASPEAVPTWDAPSRADALQAADRALRAFARPGLDARTWWTQLQPLLSPAAVVAYQGTDPANVPASKVTGSPVLVDDSSAYLARVGLRTDVGTYLVLLVRDGAGEPWLVERITPPQVGDL